MNMFTLPMITKKTTLPKEEVVVIELPLAKATINLATGKMMELTISEVIKNDHDILTVIMGELIARALTHQYNYLQANNSKSSFLKSPVSLLDFIGVGVTPEQPKNTDEPQSPAS